MLRDINMFSACAVRLLLVNYCAIFGDAQYVYNPARLSSSPVASSPIADSSNPFVYSYHSNRVGHVAQPPVVPGTPPCQKTQTYTPAPVYGPPKDSSVLKTSDGTGDFLVFVPAFPSSSLESEGESIGAAPAPGGAAGSGFIPPDGALFAPPAPLIDGTPLPAPRLSNRRHTLRYYR